MATKRPTFGTMARATCEQLLARHNVGRLAFSFRDRVDIEPIHYVFDDGWLYGRTGMGSKIVTLAHNPWVAFEVDEIDGTFDWRSVVVHGSLHVLAPDGPAAEARAWERALHLVRGLVPAALTPGDPAPFRTILFGIHIDDIAGRQAYTNETRPHAHAHGLR